VGHSVAPSRAEEPSTVAPGPNPYPPSAVFDPEIPLLAEGQLSSLAEAARSASYPLYAIEWQDSPQVWIAQTSSADGNVSVDIGLRYDSSVVVLFTPGSGVADALRQEAADWGQGYVTALAGHTAWVIPPAENLINPGVPVVYVAYEGVAVELMGRMPTSDLISLAETLHQVPE
jgi:hypothetical protein